MHVLKYFFKAEESSDIYTGNIRQNIFYKNIPFLCKLH